ncbi:MAG: hypothetical protein IPP90_09620 [Gemmatimonadaceae bacterium]|nr:hypothetical protein [Gemmatimonadaceae bacterium]
MRCTLLALSLTGRSTVASRQPESVTVLSHVTVIDVVRGIRVPDQDVVLRGARIIAVQGAGTYQLPVGARVITARNRFVIPGLWDMHTHLTDTPWTKAHPGADSTDARARYYFSALLLAAGVTGVRDLSGNLDVLQRWQQVADTARNAPPMPRALATGGKLGKEPVVPGAPFPIRTVADVQTSVRLLREHGASLVKLEAEPEPWIVRAALDACRTQHIRCVSHGTELVSLQELAASGMSSVEHLFWFPENTAVIP